MFASQIFRVAASPLVAASLYSARTRHKAGATDFEDGQGTWKKPEAVVLNHVKHCKSSKWMI